MVDNTTFLQLINDEKRNISVVFSNPSIDDDIKHKLLEYSLINCVVSFQTFISNCFDSYASGTASSSGYTPQRRLEFETPEHLHSIFSAVKKGYIDTFENGIKEYSKFIFPLGKDPFALIVQDATLWSNYNKARIIRNFLMHRSGLSEKEYRDNIPDNTTGDIKPYLDLLKMKNHQTLYTQLLDSLANITTILVNPEPYFT